MGGEVEHQGGGVEAALRIEDETALRVEDEAVLRVEDETALRVEDEAALGVKMKYGWLSGMCRRSDKGKGWGLSRGAMNPVRMRYHWSGGYEGSDKTRIDLLKGKRW